MDYGNLVSRSFEYTKDALVGKWMQWIILAVLSLVQGLTLSLIPLLSGYSVRVLSGKEPAPEVDDWVGLFVDGWKLNIISLVYMLPAIIVFLLFGGLGAIGIIASEAAGGDPAALGAAVLSIIGGFLLAGVIAIILSFIALFAILRFAHTGSMGQAFAFSAILEHIGKLGWGTWIIAVIVLIVVAFVYGFVVGIINMIPFLGFIITLFLSAGFAVFYGRYLALVYEEAPAPV
ncbi:DUF4013 domain-containing protein [Methanoculleus sp. YWC-01]|jgi:hypothetical protein|uniref:DUF4013 domain-containing protein n=1 Tax=Methanoculleus nereidis TaxID=2735141 RepID=A0ABU3Z5A8_9EURY|nr:DUF4013 domain-containing protein [Methanoculleus sp. YWC-01]MDV4343997.1 DUF4013 domain-containing protein [Methanoculleus sp. YWC-01]PKL55924.1 MAG: hypothetical protein CVV35_07385 [Methanomicrobiales archaeon HGW-Methanomicrobiales-6]